MNSIENTSPIWHPFTQHALTAPMKRIIRTEGAYLIDENNNHILDLISSWWVITHGHRHPHITKAICDASQSLDQIIFAEYSHEYADKLAHALLALTGNNYTRVFYSDSGSTSVEVALKMALGFYKHTTQTRTRIVVMEHSYHGDTIGAMSISARGVFNQTYENFLFDVATIPFPEKNQQQKTLDAFTSLCKQGDVAALILEPLVLGAGGFKIYESCVLSELKKIAEHYDCLLIADEVMTGWGRTGTLFASEQASIVPDILCTSKGLTGGALPLAATLCSEKIYAAHYSEDRRKTFFHSSSYTANPIACAAACANIEVWQNEPVFERIAALTKTQTQLIAQFYDDDRFTHIRQIGTITALDVNIQSTGYLSDVALRLRDYFRTQHLLIRPLGNVIYIMPPYCITESELMSAYQHIDKAVDLIQTATI